MGKGKYERKRQHAAERAQQEAAQARLLHGEIVATKKQSEPTKETDSHRHKKEEHSMGFRKYIERSSFTDWCIAAFTLVLAIASIYQFVIMDGQLGMMQTDQRAWLELSNEAPDLIDMKSIATNGDIRTTHLFDYTLDFHPQFLIGNSRL